MYLVSVDSGRGHLLQQLIRDQQTSSEHSVTVTSVKADEMEM